MTISHFRLHLKLTICPVSHLFSSILHSHLYSSNSSGVAVLTDWQSESSMGRILLMSRSLLFAPGPQVLLEENQLIDERQLHHHINNTFPLRHLDVMTVSSLFGQPVHSNHLLKVNVRQIAEEKNIERFWQFPDNIWDHNIFVEHYFISSSCSSSERSAHHVSTCSWPNLGYELFHMWVTHMYIHYTMNTFLYTWGTHIHIYFICAYYYFFVHIF